MTRGTYKKQPKIEADFSCFDCSVISVKEARKILGKECSEKVSDEYLIKVIGLMTKIAGDILVAEKFQKTK